MCNIRIVIKSCNQVITLTNERGMSQGFILAAKSLPYF